MNHPPKTKSSKPLIILLACTVAGVLVVLGAIYFARGRRTETPLSVERYREEGATLEGNRYMLRGQIEARLTDPDTVKSILVVRVLEDGGDEFAGAVGNGAGGGAGGSKTRRGRVPIIIPAATSENYENGQVRRFYVRIKRGALVLVDSEKE